MPQFEAKHMYPCIHSKGLLFLRYVDNIFMIWNGPKMKLISFIDELNWNHKTIKSDYKISTKQIEFLDTMVYKDQQHKIQTMILHQWTYQQTYLHAQYHPKSLKSSSPYSWVLRMKTICAAAPEFSKNCDIITKKCKERVPREIDNRTNR